MKTYEFQNYKVRFEKGEYRNGRMALELIDNTTDEPFLTVTVNMPEVVLHPGEILVKDWSENEGVLAFLQANGITTGSKRSIRVGAGFASAHVVDLLTTDL
jgi:hypothetical protein